ncbi:aminotransferase class I/II-fold pyridoxal phosphate-dependent enzyme [Sinorhizobium meliloti]|uniref:aminotransferase class I/II-fold pyridoxal phosphate-dependent enzyme n=1 Tax=Rhizobium meliloti TaxID=382 RepID=UPI001F327337|nr:aminotransferase class I/II-fold pyridoxal phosphate-dependent enzyme [Sinorhizobium meliloti]
MAGLETRLLISAVAPQPLRIQVFSTTFHIESELEPHGVGVLGATGRGTLEHFGVEGENAYCAGTLSKAFGGFGGIIPASKVLAKKIAATGAIAGASFVPIPAAAGAAAGLRLFMKDQTILQALRKNVEQMRKGLRSLGVVSQKHPFRFSPIQADV